MIKIFKNDKRGSNHLRINEEIRIQSLRLIDENGIQLGIKTLQEARSLAVERNLDLVEIAPTAEPPVCRIMDYGKYRYEQTKKEKLAKKHQHSIKLKEIIMKPNIGSHDFEIKMNHAKEFLEKGNKVKVTVKFRGREILHKEIGEELVKKFIEGVSAFGAVESNLKLADRNMSVLISPKGIIN